MARKTPLDLEARVRAAEGRARGVRASAVRYVQDHVTSPADRTALVGTPLDLSGYPASGDVSGP